MKKITGIAAAFLLLFIATSAQERITTTINSNWLFCKGDTAKVAAAGRWTPVSIPHTWNAQDVMDEEPGYYRGEGWYKKTIYIPAAWKEKDVYLYFEGVAQVAEVFLNGKPVGKHTGSYNAFSFPVTSVINYAAEGNGANELLVKVDNSHNENIPPLSADFTFYGGIYRDVWLKAVNKIHFDCDNYASSGVFVSTPAVSAAAATVNVKGRFVNGSNAKKNIVVNERIFDSGGKLFAEQKNNYTANAGQQLESAQSFNNIKGQHLWSIENP